MSTFPTLSSNPSLPINVKPEDPALTTEAEGGYGLSRPLFTRNRKTWKVTYPGMLAADFDTLVAFYTNTVFGGAMAFTWVEPLNGVSKTVRFLEDFEGNAIAWKSDGTPKYYAVSFSVKEV